MLPYWRMGRRVQAKLIQWKVLNIISVILKEVLFLGAWKKFSNSFKCNRTKIQRLWSESATYKYTMK